MSVLRNPGSEEAREMGCCCPDNVRGQGVMFGDDGPLFWVDSDCRLHGDYSHMYYEEEV